MLCQDLIEKKNAFIKNNNLDFKLRVGQTIPKILQGIAKTIKSSLSS